MQCSLSILVKWNGWLVLNIDVTLFFWPLLDSSRMLMTGRASIHACLFVKTLVRRFMAQDKPPAKNESGSIILGLACVYT